MSDFTGGPARVNTGLLVAGWVLAVIFPIIGVILGVIVLNKGLTTHGWGIIGLSVLMIAVNLAIVL